MPQRNPKYQKILTTAKSLFIKHGFKRITVEEICKLANVSKVTFYKFFKNKFEISKIVLDEIIAEAFNRYDQIMTAPISFREKLEQVLMFKIKVAKEYGEEFIKELIEVDPTLLQYMQVQQERSIALAMELLEQGKKEGLIRADLDPQFYMYMIQHINELVKDKQLKKIFPDVRKRNEELVKFWYFGMFDAMG